MTRYLKANTNICVNSLFSLIIYMHFLSLCLVLCLFIEKTQVMSGSKYDLLYLFIYLFIYFYFIYFILFYFIYFYLFIYFIYFYFILFIYLFFLWHCDPKRVMASSFLRFLDHTQRRTTFGSTPLDE
jgi:hypothetical protein